MELVGKKILIIGASSGIGEACVRRFSEAGADVAMISRNTDKMQQIASTAKGKILICSCDLQNMDSIKDVCRYFRNEEWLFDGMVYSAGILAECPVKANQMTLLEKSMNVHFYSFYEFCKQFYSKSLSKNGASIVAISSVSSYLCDKGMGPYSTAKAALDAAVSTMAKEFLARKIRVNSIQPAGVDTPMARMKRERNGVSLEDADINQPLGIITPDAVASLAQYLISDEARFITGAHIPISAGLGSV